ncbi:LPS export ABC transporter periplasmic protein LptC [Phormidium sp. FACHB-592]|uniref:LPS export ABC transporter periplasmic protein LptC n=1 Tax=Stenomitos frigidus AS-A4 TaxID=2933935 RepID=A0ABV0KQA1_9CYAN|nr:LPS export ABC transporter periplasmic protein LptC [Phormidium sp. FACHB-592]MBD2074841.1 LPS export ABC transporter periplasmic protein LptC [Phormidium sp. FACHB-592]
MPILSLLQRDRTSQSNQRQRGIRSPLLYALLLTILCTTTACGNRNRTADKIAQDTQQAQDFDNSLTFNAVTLEEFDKKGRLWWKVKAAQASYSKDKKVARLQQPAGEFFQDGVSVLQVKGQQGEVQQNGQTIFLRGKITATDTRDGLVMKGDELEWQPRKELVIVRNNLTGTHRQMKIAAKEGRLFTRTQRLELQGQVTAQAINPDLTFQSERAIWQIKQQTLTSDRPLQIDRFNKTVLTDRATANTGVADLKAKTVTLKQNARLTLTNPPTQLASNSLVWDLQRQTVASDQLLTINNSQQQVALSGNEGRIDLKAKMLYLEGDVRGVGAKNQAQLNSDRLNWNMVTQKFEADGNFRYRQGQPPLNLAGPRATGTLRGQNILVGGGRVVTEFIP